MIAALAVLLVAAVPFGARAAEPVAKTRLVLLPLQSYALTAEELDSVSRELVERFRADPGLEVVDAAPVLGEKASGDWLKADKLLYDGIQDYQNLEFVKAVEQLRESAELMERTFREFADVQGRRRLRDAYLHVGLARLEQGEQKEAEEWFAKAARVDPGFEPDPRAYPPAVRAKFLEAKNERLDASYEASRGRLRELGKLVGVDVVVAGGVRHEGPGQGGWFVEVAWVDRWSGNSSVETASASSREDLARAVRDASPKLIAGVLQKPWPPEGASRTRRRLAMGAAGALLPDARVRKSVPGQTQPFLWSDTIQQTGVRFALCPWERGGWAMETDLSIYLPQPMSPKGWQGDDIGATGDFEGGGSVGAHALRTVRHGRWGLTGGAGFAINESIASFRTTQNATGVVFLWMTPVVSISGTRTIVARGGVDTFLEVEVAASYDALGSGPSDWLFQSVAGGGIAF